MKTLLALRNKKGFTLVELIVVIAIIAVLVAIAVPAMVGYIERANEQVAASNCRAVVSAASAASSAALADMLGTHPVTGGGTADNGYLQEVNMLLNGVAGDGTSKTYGGGTFAIFTTDATTEATNGWDGGPIHSVTWTKGSGTGAGRLMAKWIASTNTIEFSKTTT